MKKCARCKRNRTKRKFASHRRSKDGLQSYCRDCTSEYRKERSRLAEPRPPRTDGTKRCCSCEKKKPRTEFGKHRNRADGRNSVCRVCMRDYSSAHYARNSEKKKAQATVARQARVDAGSIVERDYARRYRRDRSGEPRFELSRRLADARKRAKRRGLPATVTIDEVMALWEAGGGRCALTGWRMSFCGGGVTDPHCASIDRIDPARGYEPDNVRLVCWMANKALAAWGQGMFVAMCRAVVEVADAQANRRNRHRAGRSG